MKNEKRKMFFLKFGTRVICQYKAGIEQPVHR
jgi:hypothetical protein